PPSPSHAYTSPPLSYILRLNTSRTSVVTPLCRNLKGLARKVTGRFTWKDVTAKISMAELCRHGGAGRCSSPGRESSRAATKASTRGLPPSSLIHVTVRHRRRGCRLVLRDIRDERFGGEQQGGDRCRVLERHALDFGRVDDPRLEHVHELHAVGVEPPRGHRLVLHL